MHAKRSIILGAAGLVLSLVAPVRRDARLGDPVHLGRPDLTSMRSPKRPDHRRVEGTGTCWPRHRDVSRGKAAGHRLSSARAPRRAPRNTRAPSRRGAERATKS